MITELLLVIPFLFLFIAYASGDIWAKWVTIFSTFLSLGITIASFIFYHDERIKPFLEANYNWLKNPNINFHLTIDGLTIIMLLLTNSMAFLISLASFSDKAENKKSYYALILLMIAALNGVFMASDGFLFYIFWEITLIPIYFIALLWGGKNRMPVTFKFFIYTLFGSLFLLIGFVYLYSIGGSLSIDKIYHLEIDQSSQLWLFWFIFIAFAIKIPIFPFHSWQAETYKESPTTGTMLLSGIMLKMGLFGIIKWLIPILPYATKFWTPIVIVLCVIGVIYGAILTFSQKNTKHFLAYSSLSHVGLMAAGIFSLSNYGWQGAIIQMVAHAVNVVGLFFVIEVMARRTGTYKIAELGGIRQQSPWFATFFMVILFASISLPLTNAFVGEYLLFLGLFHYNETLAIVSGISVILGAAYMLWFYQKTMLGETSEKSKNFIPLHWSEIMVLGLIISIILGFGIHPQPIIDVVQPTLKEILKFGLK